MLFTIKRKPVVSIESRATNKTTVAVDGKQIFPNITDEKVYLLSQAVSQPIANILIIVTSFVAEVVSKRRENQKEINIVFTSFISTAIFIIASTDVWSRKNF